jgi:NTE family protein
VAIKIRKGKKVGLALSGGAARGFAHVGVLEVFQKEGIPIDIIAGTSAGAIAGAIYAWNQDFSKFKKDLLAPGWKKYAPLIDPALFKSGVIKGDKIKTLLASYIGSKTRFSDLRIPLACVATDIETGEEIVIDQGSVLEAVRASISIPGIFNLVKYDKRHLADGGLTTPVPINVARNMGADFVIAVNVTPPLNDRIKKRGKVPNIFNVIMQSIYITTNSVARNSLENADFVIEPDLSGISPGDFNQARVMISGGAEAARAALPEITRKLRKL